MKSAFYQRMFTPHVLAAQEKFNGRAAALTAAN